jgi:hypothetical protein
MQTSFDSPANTAFSLPLRSGLLLHALAFVVTVLPLCLVTIPPLVDYLNHLARMHILYDYASSAALQQNYTVQWQMTPYLAMEAVVLPLLRLTDIYTAGKIFIVLGLLLTATGVVGVRLATSGRLSWLDFFVYPVLYSVNLGWGFVPFVFSIGVMLCLFCGFLWLMRRPYAAQLAYVSVATVILFFCHLITVGFFALLVACAVTADSRWFSRDFFRRGCALLPAFVPVAFLWTQVPPPPFATDVTQGWLNPIKLAVLAFNGNYVVAVLVSAAVMLALYAGWREKVLAVPSPVLRRCLVVLGVVLPERLMNIGLFGLRLPYLWLLLLPTALTLRLEVVPVRKVYRVLAGVTLCFVIRHVTIATALGQCDAMLTEFRAAAQQLPRGTTLTATYNMTGASPCANIHWPEHVNTLAVIERDVFAPNLFSKIYPVRPSATLDDPRYAAIAPPEIKNFFTGGPDYLQQPQKMRDWRQNFNYLVYFHFNEQVPIPGATAVVRGSYFSLLRIETPKGTPSSKNP